MSQYLTFSQLDTIIKAVEKEFGKHPIKIKRLLKDLEEKASSEVPVAQDDVRKNTLYLLKRYRVNNSKELNNKWLLACRIYTSQTKLATKHTIETSLQNLVDKIREYDYTKNLKKLSIEERQEINIDFRILIYKLFADSPKQGGFGMCLPTRKPH